MLTCLRFHNKEALQIILRIFAGNGVEHALVAQHGMASTPAGSAIIRARKCTGILKQRAFV